MNISIEKAIELLENCSAVIIENTVIFPSVEENDVNGVFLFLNWEDNKEEFYETFYQKDNLKVKIEGSSMFLYNEDSDIKEITLLLPWNLEIAE